MPDKTKYVFALRVLSLTKRRSVGHTNKDGSEEDVSEHHVLVLEGNIALNFGSMQPQFIAEQEIKAGDVVKLSLEARTII